MYNGTGNSDTIYMATESRIRSVPVDHLSTPTDNSLAYGASIHPHCAFFKHTVHICSGSGEVHGGAKLSATPGSELVNMLQWGGG